MYLQTSTLLDNVLRFRNSLISNLLKSVVISSNGLYLPHFSVFLYKKQIWQNGLNLCVMVMLNGRVTERHSYYSFSVDRNNQTCHFFFVFYKNTNNSLIFVVCNCKLNIFGF